MKMYCCIMDVGVGQQLLLREADIGHKRRWGIAEKAA
jgi:hypothetical protein